MKKHNEIISQKIFKSLESFLQTNISWKEHHEKVVFTNGCFDIMHLGHVDYLSKAADLGNKLIVGLNSDSSTRTLKGPHRPINDEKSRAGVLASLFFVDAVILFDDETPLHLIKEIGPDFLVKGADYTFETIVGAKEVLARNGEVKTIEFLEGYSTSLIEKKIIEANK
ncbi:MAG: D-glycero-beta-D-manno-heptose 1-phosphate adenylyltransferase [Pelobium sp.]